MLGFLDDIFWYYGREFKRSKDSKDDMLRKEVIGVTKSGGAHTCAEFSGNNWVLTDSRWSLKLPGTIDEDGYIFELIGDHNVSISLSISFVQSKEKL